MKINQKTKGIAVKTIGAVTLIMITGSITMTALTSDKGLGGDLESGFDKLSNSTAGGAGIIEVKTDQISSARQKFSDIVLLAKKRAQDCEKVNSHEFNWLEGTELTQTPSCKGAGESIARGWEDFDGESDGNDQEGIYSRVNFEIKENFTISTGRDRVPLEDLDWAGIKLTAVRDGSYRELTEDANTQGSIDNVLVFLGQEQDVYYRTNKFLEEHSKWSDESTTWNNGNLPDWNDLSQVDGAGQKVKFCEGDRGYVQVNSHTPRFDGESGEEGSLGDFFTSIVLTETIDKCGDISRIPESDPVVGNTLYLDYDSSEHLPYPFFRSPEQSDYVVDLVNEERGYDEVSSSGSIDSSRCGIFLNDNEGGESNHGWLSYQRGDKISQSGTLPEYQNSKHDDSDEGDGTQKMLEDLRNMGFGYEYANTHEDYGNEGDIPYSPYIKGFDQEIDTENAKMKQRMLLVGDLLCVTSDVAGEDTASWMICNYRLPEEKREVSFDGATWNCNPRSGGWSEE